MSDYLMQLKPLKPVYLGYEILEMGLRTSLRQSQDQSEAVSGPVLDPVLEPVLDPVLEPVLDPVLESSNIQLFTVKRPYEPI